MTDLSPGGPGLDDFDSDATMVATILDRFHEGGPPFVNELRPWITHAAVGRVRFDVDVTDHVVHSGGVMCGQSIMACMDTGMVFAMASLRDGEIVPFTTVSLNTNFERAVPADVGTVTFDATVTKPGRSVVFGQVDLMLPDGRRAATATTTYVWL
ncbi:MAG: PaaI family thioesterase [Actinomycetota bacterium]